MLYLLSAVNLLKNLVVKLWSYTFVRIIVSLAFGGYVAYTFGSTVMSRMSNSSLTFTGFSQNFYIPDFEFNPNFIKSNKARFGIMDAINRLGSVFVPGLLAVAIILYIQKALNTFKAPPLPIIYRAEDAEDVIVEDYRMPVLYTKGESFDYDDDEEDFEDEEESTSSASSLKGATV